MKVVPSPSAFSEIIPFAEFEADLRSRELRRQGARVKVPEQSFRVLALLLEHAGELVTREEIHKKLWPEDTFVDFDHGVHNAVNRLREALGDSADSPRFIETLPRRGYRFIGSINGPRQNTPAVVPAVGPEQRSGSYSFELGKRERRKLSYWWLAFLVAAVIFGLLAITKFFLGRRGASVPIRAMAVLPLQNLSGDPAQEYFADGMTDALITNMARIGSLRVISRTSVMTYKATRKPLAEIARELNVDAIVEGSVVRSGNRVRVNAQLIQVIPERHLWANAYERDVTDIIALQGDVARAIANEIQIQLTPQERAHLTASRVVNPDAYSKYLMGRYFLDRAGKDNLQKAVSYYQEAIHLDPNYALAWAGLADGYRYLGGGGHLPSSEAEQKSRAAIERAIELDPDLAEAYAVLGAIQTFVDWNWTAAGASFERALALEPGNVSALRGAAFLDTILGRLEDALQLAGRAVERDPLNPRSHRLLGGIENSAGHLDASITALNRSIQLNPEGIYAHTDLAWVYLAKSHPHDALGEIEKERASERYFLGLAVAYHALGREKDSDTALANLIKKHGDVAAFQVAQAYAFRGDPDRAFEWLERAYIQRDGALVTVSFDPLLGNLHRDRRWAAFLKKMHLPV
jgi:TolB-like protein/DNA-binding winged helix-turn-helix (wHTH) protein/Tfp pilus assembly protein PilF